MRLCRTCQYLVMDVVRPNDFSFARCLKFGDQCMVSGTIRYNYAERCRRDSTMCGNEGNSYKQKTLVLPIYKII